MLRVALSGVIASAGSVPFFEPSYEDWFGKVGGQDVPRFTNVTLDEVQRMIVKGQPFVVTDHARDWTMKDWDCYKLSKVFDGGKFRLEYGRGEKNRENFADDWQTKKEPIPYPRGEIPKGAPKYRPFYWDIVKALDGGEHARGWGNNAPALVSKLNDAFSVPYWLHKDNAKGMVKNPEFWFQPPEAGSQAHLDSHCTTTIATTLSGRKKWRFSLVPEKPHPDGYFDGKVYQRGEFESPMWEVVNEPGEAVIFPPGIIHEGQNIHDEECVSSATYQFDIPTPAQLFRAYFPRLRQVEDFEECVREVHFLATLGKNAKPVSAKKADDKAAKMLAAADTDKDSVLSRDELRHFSGVRNEHRLQRIVDYHDNDFDGKVTGEEFAANFVAWSVVEHKFSRGRGREEL